MANCNDEIHGRICTNSVIGAGAPEVKRYEWYPDEEEEQKDENREVKLFIEFD